MGKLKDMLMEKHDGDDMVLCLQQRIDDLTNEVTTLRRSLSVIEDVATISRTMSSHVLIKPGKDSTSTAAAIPEDVV